MQKVIIPHRTIILIVLVLCVFHFIFLMNFFAPAISTPDAQGYFTQVRQIATRGQTFLIPENNLQYLGPHWHSPDGEKYYTTFPPGYPLLLAISYKIFGAKSTYLVNPVLASLGILLFFLLSKTVLSNTWALISTLFFSINPFYNEHALFGDSHISVIFFFLLGLLFMMRAIKNGTHSYAIISGIVMGVIPTIRYAEFGLSFVFGLYIFWLFYKKQISFGTFISFFIGILIPLILLAVRNQLAFGKPWMSGYNLARSQALFSIHYFVGHFMPLVSLLITAGMGILFLYSIGGFTKFIEQTKTRFVGIYYLSSVVVLTFIYMAYFWPPDPQSMRFLLPTFPIYTLMAVYFISRLEKKRQIIFLSMALIISVPWGVIGSLRKMNALYEKNKVLAEITRTIEGNVDEGSIIITSEGICQNLDLYGRWKLIDISIFSNAESMPIRRPSKPLRNEQTAQIYKPLYGSMFITQLTKDLSHWSSKNIFMIAYENDIKFLNGLLKDRFHFIKKTIIEIFRFPARKLFPISKPTNMSPELRFGPQLQLKQIRPERNNWIFDFEIKNEPLIITELTIK